MYCQMELVSPSFVWQWREFLGNFHHAISYLQLHPAKDSHGLSTVRSHSCFETTTNVVSILLFLIFSIVVQTKPGDNVWAYENWWSYRLHNCCEDAKLCLFDQNEIIVRVTNCSLFLRSGCAVCWCCPCLMHRVYKRADEDMLSCCWPLTFPLLRTKIRTLFRIRVSECKNYSLQPSICIWSYF